MAYNVYEYQSSISASRKSDLFDVINAVNPDIFIGVEIQDDLSTADNFRTTVLNSSVTDKYYLGSQPSPTDAYGNGNGKFSNFLYYKPGKFNFVSASIIAENGKWPTLKYELYHPGTGNTIIIYGAHLTSGSDNVTQRQNEANAIRNSTALLVSGTYFIGAGDFNLVSGPGENAYSILTNTGSSGYFIDDGDFSSDYETFATPDLGDRYDMILNALSITGTGYIRYNSGSFIVLGNINGSTDTNLPYETASDHLPVYADYDFYNNPTPVELISFTGETNGTQVDLHWRTETEVNNYGFSIERSSSSPGTKWETIGFIQGHGNSNSPNDYSYTDLDIHKPDIYSYRLKQTDNDGTFKYSNIVNVNVTLPGNYYLSQNYPNPFNPETKIDFTIPERQNVTLKVYNTLGEQVAELLNEEKDAGNYSVSFNASNLPSGIYIYTLATQNRTLIKKMTVLK